MTPKQFDYIEHLLTRVNYPFPVEVPNNMSSFDAHRYIESLLFILKPFWTWPKAKQLEYIDDHPFAKSNIKLRT